MINCPKCGSKAMHNGYVYCRSKYEPTKHRIRRYICNFCHITFYSSKVRAKAAEKKIRRSIRMKVKDFQWEHWFELEEGITVPA
jgi:hypothetical protein